MVRYLHLSRSLIKRLEILRLAGREGTSAAERCDHILKLLRKQGVTVPEIFCKRTKHGEGRIDNCVKYDLGNGYRLVTVLSGNRLFIPFVGTHDETSIWLDHHRDREFSEKSGGYNCEVIGRNHADPTDSKGPDSLEREPTETDLYEESINARLDETMLKSIFRGLYRSADYSSARSTTTDDGILESGRSSL